MKKQGNGGGLASNRLPEMHLQCLFEGDFFRPTTADETGQE
jgi:hypothetical protein